MKYDAFISYSHSADGRLAPAVQSGLQRLARPWYRRSALRVFRDETGLAQALPERTDQVRGGGSRGGPEKPDHRQRRLRARGEGPSDCGAAQHS